jgi:alkaline phosphatase D
MNERFRSLLKFDSMGRREFLGLSLLSMLFLSGCKVFGVPLPSVESKRPLRRIAFGSCMQQADPQPIWDVIGRADPDLFLFIGDNVYADTEDMDKMRRDYEMLGAKPQYQRFRAAVPIEAIADDHDYGINDGGMEYPKKEESKQIMLDFFGEPKDSERRRRPGNYTSYMHGPSGQRVQVILMDLRWFRTALISTDNGYVPNPDPQASMLGEAQWAWLEQELQKPARVRVIASTTQFSSSDHPWEKWANFPLEKARMLALLDRLNVRNAVIISGDMHFAELSAEKTPGGFMLYDITSSGMNFYEPGVQFQNRNRIAIHDTSPNFGMVEFTWEKSRVIVSLQARNDKGETVIRKDIAV